MVIMVKIYLKNFYLDLSEKFEIPIIASHEVFYLDKEMHEAHDAYLCVGEKTYVNVKIEENIQRTLSKKSSEEMYEIFSDLT